MGSTSGRYAATKGSLDGPSSYPDKTEATNSGSTGVEPSVNAARQEDSFREVRLNLSKAFDKLGQSIDQMVQLNHDVVELRQETESNIERVAEMQQKVEELTARVERMNETLRNNTNSD